MANAPLPVVCIAGPTGTGKTAAAIAAALRFHGEIINADSRQVYADFPIITAQPDVQERATCPHHLYGFLKTQAKIPAGQWQEKALIQITDILSRGKLPILVGGTGLYLKIRLSGIANIPPLDLAITQRLIEIYHESG